VIILEAYNDQKILVTGASGFIGSHVAAALATTTCRLSLLDTAPHAGASLSASRTNASLHAIDILDPQFASWLQKERFDFIFHFAGNANVGTSVAKPFFDFDVNLRASLSILEAIRQAGSATVLIYASSAAVYGNPARVPITETDQTVPISPYGVGKLAMERYLAVYCKLYGLRGASVRMFSPFGPYLRKQLVFDLMQKIHAHPAVLDVHGDGTQSRDFIYIDDVVSAILQVASKGCLDGTTYNVGRGIETSVSEVAHGLVDLMSPGLAVRYSGQPMPGYPDNWCADITRAHELGWSPQVSLDDGLRRTVAWYTSENP
jgi:UDP-glucose 4-epimerase